MRAALAVTARNGPTVQDSEASANPTPYPSMDPIRAVGAHREPGRTGTAADFPASNHPPRTTRAAPITTVANGTYCCTVDATETVSAPNPANTTSTPAVMAAVASTARPTARPVPTSVRMTRPR